MYGQDVMALIFIFVVFGLFLLLYIARQSLALVTISGDSMLPAIRPGDKVIVLKIYRPQKLQKGQIVLVNPPYNGHALIKRITGLSGDTVYAPTLDLPENFNFVGVHPDDLAKKSIEKSWEVPPGKCFVQGDNWISSSDSRNWGPMPLTDILGIVLFKLSTGNQNVLTVVER